MTNVEVRTQDRALIKFIMTVEESKRSLEEIDLFLQPQI